MRRERAALLLREVVLLAGWRWNQPQKHRISKSNSLLMAR